MRQEERCLRGDVSDCHHCHHCDCHCHQLLTTDDAMHCNGDADTSVNRKYELTPLTEVFNID